MNATKKASLIILACFAISGCTSEGSAKNALEGAGYRSIRMTGYRVFGCSKSDDFHTGFDAIGPTGKHVTGVVCSGWLKGSTIRTD